MIAIGIDPGVTTGLAVWDAGDFKLRSVESMGVIRAMEFVIAWQRLCASQSVELFVIVEDARKRKFRYSIADENEEKYGAGVREGVGSVKRDSKIWEEFLQHHSIAFEMRTPRATKMPAESFERLTGWSERTNKHERDAAMIVFQLNKTILRLKLQTYKERLEPGHEPGLPERSSRSGRRRRYLRT